MPSSVENTDRVGHVIGRPRTWLRLDAGVVLVASLATFHLTHQHWWLYPALLFVPDVFMLGYLRNTRVGAFFYNTGHSYFVPAAVLTYGWLGHHAFASAIAIIWLGHVGWDRFFGYGLKYDSGFAHTHLGDLKGPGARQRDPRESRVTDARKP